MATLTNSLSNSDLASYTSRIPANERASMERKKPEITSSTDTPEQTTAPEQKVAAGDLGTIQQILFGEQWRADNDRLSNTIDQFNTWLAALEARTEQKLQQHHETLTATFNDRLKTLETQISAASDMHRTKINEINQQLASNNDLVKTQLNDLSKDTRERQNKIERHLQDTAANLGTSLQATHDDLNTKLGNALAELRSNKVERQSLSKILGDAAKRLEDEQA